MDEIKQALILLNPRAGRGEPELAESILTQALQQHHWQVRCQTIDKGATPQELIPILAAAAVQGVTLVVAAGGDGTVSLVASAIILSGHSSQLRLGGCFSNVPVPPPASSGLQASGILVQSLLTYSPN